MGRATDGGRRERGRGDGRGGWRWERENQTPRVTEGGRRQREDRRERGSGNRREGDEKNWPGCPKFSLKYDMFSAVGSFALCNGWDETSHNVCENGSHLNKTTYIYIYIESTNL